MTKPRHSMQHWSRVVATSSRHGKATTVRTNRTLWNCSFQSRPQRGGSASPRPSPGSRQMGGGRGTPRRVYADQAASPRNLEEISEPVARVVEEESRKRRDRRSAYSATSSVDPGPASCESRSRLPGCRSHIGRPRWSCGSQFGLRSLAVAGARRDSGDCPVPSSVALPARQPHRIERQKEDMSK